MRRGRENAGNFGIVNALPIDAAIPRIVEALASHANLVIEAAPGAGKTTRVPPALLNTVEGEILVLEPRRLAARLAARRVAQELGEEVGETVGYQVRFEDLGGPRTRLRFLTEGMLTRRILSDPMLGRVDLVVLDEFHERHLDTDLALALLRRLQKARPRPLKIVVMSATLDPRPVARFLGGAPVEASKGRLYPIETEFTPHSPSPLEELVAAALEKLTPLNGDVLVFLPGAAEIRRAGAGGGSDCPAREPARGAALWRPLPGRAGPCRGAGGSAESDPFHQRRRELDHHRRCHRGDRQRAGAHCQRLPVDRTAGARSVAHQQGVGQAAGGACRPHGAGSGDPAVLGRRLCPPARARHAGDLATGAVAGDAGPACPADREPGVAGSAAGARRGGRRSVAGTPGSVAFRRHGPVAAPSAAGALGH